MTAAATNLHAAIPSLHCPKCGAIPGDQCRTPRGRIVRPHRERIAAHNNMVARVKSIRKVKGGIVTTFAPTATWRRLFARYRHRLERDLARCIADTIKKKVKS